MAYLPSVGKHRPDIVEFSPVSCETTWSGGEYVATLPTSANDGVTDEIAVSVGLGHRAVFSSSASVSRATRAVEGETEGQISWYFETSRTFETSYATQLATTVDRINGYIHGALKQIDALGFKLSRPRRRIPITLFKKEPEMELWGEFKQHYSDDTHSWFAIREDMLSDPGANQQDVKATIYHELLHYFQADYDQRVPFLKFRSCNGDELLMYEAGGQWIEKFVYGQFPANGDNIRRYKHFVKGLNDIEAIYRDLDIAKNKKGNYDIGKARQSHGYAMALLWEYLASELGDKAIVDIYYEWARKVITYGWENETTYNTLRSFADVKRSYLFAGGYTSFLLQCAGGVIAPGFDIYSFDAETKELTTETKAFEFEGVNYAYGADAKDIFIRWRSSESLRDKELVIKPQTADMDTYVFGDDRKQLRDDPYTDADEIVIPGSELEKGRSGDLVKGHYILLTTHYPSSVYPTPKNYRISVELRDAEEPAPTPHDGTTLAVGVVDFDCRLSAMDAWTSWTEGEGETSGTRESSCDFSFQTTFADSNPPRMTATLTGTTIHAEAYDPDYEATLTFDITGFTGDYTATKVTNLVFRQGDTKVNISLIPVNVYVRKTDYTVWLWFEATEAQGLLVSSLYHLTTWEGQNFNGHGTDTYTYLSDPTNYAKLDFRFDPPGQ